MTVYKNLAGNVGVCSYEFGENEIRIKFHSRKSFIFDNKHTGELHINQMRALAIQGFGLNTYINDNVKNKYATTLD